MPRLLRLATAAVFALSVSAVGCASDDPRYADPPPGSASPAAQPDERGTGDRLRDSPDEEGPEAEEEDLEEPPPERE